MVLKDVGPIDEQALKETKTALSMTKSTLEREEGLALLDQIPMTFPLLMKTMSGQKLQRCFRSSRYKDLAIKTHTRWTLMVEKEVYDKWEQTKHLFLTKQQISELNKAQTAWERKNPPPLPPLEEVPITPGRIRDDSLTEMNSSFSRDLDTSNFQRDIDRWYLEPAFRSGVPRTPGHHDTDDSMDELALGSEASTSSYNSFMFSSPGVRRPRGRPRSRGVATLPRRGRRGRPPLNR